MLLVVGDSDDDDGDRWCYITQICFHPDIEMTSGNLVQWTNGPNLVIVSNIKFLWYKMSIGMANLWLLELFAAQPFANVAYVQRWRRWWWSNTRDWWTFDSNLWYRRVSLFLSLFSIRHLSSIDGCEGRPRRRNQFLSNLHHHQKLVASFLSSHPFIPHLLYRVYSLYHFNNNSPIGVDFFYITLLLKSPNYNVVVQVFLSFSFFFVFFFITTDVDLRQLFNSCSLYCVSVCDCSIAPIHEFIIFNWLQVIPCTVFYFSFSSFFLLLSNFSVVSVLFFWLRLFNLINVCLHTHPSMRTIEADDQGT